MTISELKLAMDRRFNRLERTKADKEDLRKLTRAMERRLNRLERRKADKTELRSLARAMGRRFDRLKRTMGRLQKTKVDKAELRRAITRLRREIAASAEDTCRSLREEIAASAEETRRYLREEMMTIAVETRRHFDTTIENLPARFQAYGDGILANTAKLENHEVRSRDSSAARSNPIRRKADLTVDDRLTRQSRHAFRIHATARRAEIPGAHPGPSVGARVPVRCDYRTRHIHHQGHSFGSSTLLKAGGAGRAQPTHPQAPPLVSISSSRPAAAAAVPPRRRRAAPPATSSPDTSREPSIPPPPLPASCPISAPPPPRSGSPC